MLAYGSCDSRPQSKPAHNEFVGEWELPRSDFARAKQYFKCPVEDCKLTLKADGTCEARNVPLVYSKEGRLEYLCTTRTGTWQVERQQFWMLTVVFDNDHHPFEVRRYGRGFELVEFYVDPDGAFYSLRRPE